ncbi:zinc ribbon domain-containing protein [Nocardioides sp. WG-D5]|uniref:zinc ribbon domain-containing protein n=1 Tax=Nocardioides luteus TaxID=1844 RepID=UPI0002029381|nr:C4-type zinc ribbon domain-containing protein [Nocardioides luteus]EGD43825.1 putative zinc ribbon domain protein [Nocardioidaceae bacterium Broad-1]MBG6095573.1 putative nucleic acid-binding Zn-ribbon protein [Nocardioides luteus]
MKLLDVCELDSRALQLRHRRAHLPQAAVVAELQASKKTTDDAVRDARVTRDDLERVQKKADADVEAVKTRRRRDQERMDSGAISSAKDLERMQHELATLDRRISVLEDEELEVMEQLEEAQANVTRLEAELAEITEKLAVAVDSVNVETSKIDTELAAVAEERTPALEGIPDDLLALYSRLSEKMGVGAAELRARRCGGCNLQLDPAEISRIRGLAADEVVRCEECSRILVRTAESGL